MTEPNAYTPLLGAIRSTSQQLEDSRRRVTHAHPSWAGPCDARLTVFAKLANTLRAAELSLMFLEAELADPNWWIMRHSLTLQGKEFTYVHMAYSQFAKGGFLQFAFSAADSGFRLLVRAIDSDACSGGTANFQSVAHWLFEQLSAPPPNVELVDMLRILRNTIHNEGVYFDRRVPDRVIVYRGAEYRFRNGEPIEFGTWAFLIQLIGDWFVLIEHVVSDARIASIPGRIVDPACEPSHMPPRTSRS